MAQNAKDAWNEVGERFASWGRHLSNHYKEAGSGETARDSQRKFEAMFPDDGSTPYNFHLDGRAKKNWKTCDLILADPGAGMVVSIMDEDDVQTIMRDPLIGVGSDNGIPVGLQHPRTWGCFPRFLGRYVRELELIPPTAGRLG